MNEAGGGNAQMIFMKYLINENSEVTVKQVSNALRELKMRKAMREWERICGNKAECCDVQEHDVQVLVHL